MRTEDDADETLMLRYRDGNADAFAALYARQRGTVSLSIAPMRPAGVGRGTVSGRGLKLIAARTGYTVQARFTTYLYRLAHNRLIDHYRASSRGLPLSYAEDCPEWAEVPAPAEVQPEAQDDRRRQAERLLELLAELPEAQREAVLLKEEAGLSLEEIAQATGTGRETVKSRLRYAMARLRQGFERCAMSDPRNAEFHDENLSALYRVTRDPEPPAAGPTYPDGRQRRAATGLDAGATALRRRRTRLWRCRPRWRRPWCWRWASCGWRARAVNGVRCPRTRRSFHSQSAAEADATAIGRAQFSDHDRPSSSPAVELRPTMPLGEAVQWRRNRCQPCRPPPVKLEEELMPRRSAPAEQQARTSTGLASGRADGQRADQGAASQDRSDQYARGMAGGHCRTAASRPDGGSGRQTGGVPAAVPELSAGGCAEPPR